MATVNVRFPNVTVYDVNKLDVKLAEKFELELVDQDGETDWYSNQDQVLNIIQSGNLAAVEATALGSSKIRIFDENDSQIMEINLTVVEGIKPQAASLGMKVGDPEYKSSSIKKGG